MTEFDEALHRFVEEGDESALSAMGELCYRRCPSFDRLRQFFSLLWEEMGSEKEQPVDLYRLFLLVIGGLEKGWVQAQQHEYAMQVEEGLSSARLLVLRALASLVPPKGDKPWEKMVQALANILEAVRRPGFDFFLIHEEEHVVARRISREPLRRLVSTLVAQYPKARLPFPIIVAGEIAGSLFVEGETLHALTFDDFLFYEAVARQTALALDRVRLQEEKAWQLRTWQLLSQLNRSLLGASSYEELVHILVDHGKALAFEGVTLFAVRRWDEYGLPLVVDVYQRFRPAGDEIALHFENIALPKRSWCQGQRFHLWNNLELLKERRIGTETMWELISRYQLRVAFSLRLCRDHKLFGILVFFSRSARMIDLWRSHLDGETEMPDLLLADAVGATLENLTIVEMQERSRRALSLLYRALSELNTAGDYDEIIAALRQHTAIGKADIGVGLVAFSPFWGREAPRWIYPLEAWRRDGERIRVARYPFSILTPMQAALARGEILRLGAAAEELTPDVWALFEGLLGDDLEHVKTLFVIPLVARGEKIGLLLAAFSYTFTYTDEEKMLMERISEQAAAALRSIIRISEVELRAMRLQTAADVARATTSILDLETLLNYVVDLVRRRFDLYYVGIFLVDETGEWAVLRAGTGEAGRKMLENRHRLKIGGRSMIGACIATSQARIALDVGEEAVRFDNPYLPETRSEMALPLLARGQVIGAMTIQSTEQAAFSEDDVSILQTVADQLANAIENARLFAQVQASLAELVAVQRQATAESWAQVVAQQEIVGYSYDLRELVPVAEAASADAIPEALTVEEEAGEVVIKAPIAVRGYPIGMVEIEAPLTFDPYLRGDLTMIEQVQSQLSMTLENRILFEQTRIALAETQRLYETGQQIGAEVTVDGIFFAMLDGLKHRAEPRFIEVLRVENRAHGDEVSPVADLLMAWDRNEEAMLPLEHTIALESMGQGWEILLRQYYLYVHNLEQTDLLAPELIEYYRQHGKSLLIYLITVQRQPFALVTISLPTSIEFSEKMRRFYDALIYTTSVALANRLLLQQTQQDVERRAFINEVMRTAASYLDPDRLLQAVGELVARRYWMPVLLFRMDGDRLRAVAIFYENGGRWESLEGHRFRLIDLPGIGAVVRLRKPLLWHFDARPYRSTIFESILDHLNLAAAYSIPLMLRDEVLGIIAIGIQKGHSPMNAVEMMTLQNVAVNLGVAVENARLYQDAQETAEKLKEVDRLKSEFLASMSHELRTPLNSIIGFSRVILKGIDGPLTDLQKTDLTAIYDSGRHLLNLINDILDLSKIEAGKMEFTFEPVNLKEIIQSVLTTAVALVKDKPIKLQSEVPDDLPTIIADGRRIRQVVLNLVGNAAKFTEKGYIRVRATYNEREVIIAVEDTGIGIPKEKFPLVFQEFQQVDSSSTRRYGGTGLGLPVSKRFVEAHGGRIWFESEEGVGSTFYVALPIGGPQSVRDTVEEEAHPSEERTVLVIDDDPAVVTLFQRYLEQHGYRVVGLTNPAQAVEEAKQLKPYAVTLDLVMPGMDGWQVLQQLKSHAETRDIPVIICSIAGDGIERGITMGITDYLVKPITEEHLIAVLERLAYNDEIYRILVVDDSPRDRKLMRRILESAGHIVEEAEGGRVALEKVQAAAPDLILLDLMMPDVDGAAVLAELKGNPRTRHIPVIIVTAKEMDEEERRKLLEQSEALLQKGQFEEEELLRDVLEVLNRLRREHEEEEEA